MSLMLESGSSAFDYTPLDVAPQPVDEASARHFVPSSAAFSSAVDLVELVRQGGQPDTVVRAAELILLAVAGYPGETWQDRWVAFEAVTPGAMGVWLGRVGGLKVRPVGVVPRGLFELFLLDVFRPSYEWLYGKKFRRFEVIAQRRHAAETAAFTEQLERIELSPASAKTALVSLARLCARNGKTPSQLDAGDILEMRAVAKQLSCTTLALRSTWSVLRELGWLDDPAVSMPVSSRRGKPKTAEEFVDGYNIPSPQREVLIEYLKHRSAAMDYSSSVNLSQKLVGLFWADIVKHHPGIESFALDRAVVEGWKQRLRRTTGGGSRSPLGALHVLIAVRAFYLDIGHWALVDSYWAPWAIASPISRAEVSGIRKIRRKQIARQHQRTRDLAPLLPQLVKAAEDHKREAAALLAAARLAGPGGRINIDGEDWTVHQATPQSELFAQRGAARHCLEIREARAFWTWAAVETLRHSGIRIEEMLELTHLSFQPYVIKPTGETVPLVHLAASKTDQERMLVASPELVHVLSEILTRVRRGQGQVPLTQRWDNHERMASDVLPHLFVEKYNKELRVMSSGTINSYLVRISKDLTVNGEPIHFTPHDLRRLFATDALASGLPPHIVQVLMGHRSVATTQSYAAIYPQDVIRHHRTFISLRRQLRPSEEYREPTQAEWAEFEAHFVQRKLSLGSCGRAYGTDCHHEHACLRCALLRPDPNQIDRLRDIITNLGDRITEAETAGWVGEKEGLKVSLAGAEEKLNQMQRQLQRDRPGQAFLGLPLPPAPAPGAGQLGTPVNMSAPLTRTVEPKDRR